MVMGSEVVLSRMGRGTKLGKRGKRGGWRERRGIGDRV